MDMTIIDGLALKFDRITAGEDQTPFWRAISRDEFNYERIGYGRTPKVAVENLLSTWADCNEFWDLDAKNSL